MAKSKDMQILLDNISKVMFGNSRQECIDRKVCVICGSSATEFNDVVSEAEFCLSAMCQECQDRTFRPMDTTLAT